MNVEKMSLYVFCLVMSVIPGVAEAHQLAGESIGVLSGLIHPLANADHVLAMLAVGLWFAQIGGRAVYFMPIAFAGLMLAGGGLTLIPIEIAYVESSMTLSVLILGLMLVSAIKVSPPVVMIVVGCFALLHGYTHAADMLMDVDASAYTYCFVLVTALLNFIGVIIGLLCNRFDDKNFIRYLGGIIAVSGVWLVTAA